jgi:predicted amidohydrolase
MAEALIRRAAAEGAVYVQTPENTSIMELETDRLLSAIDTEEKSEPLRQLQALAKELGIWLHVGSLAMKLPSGKVANRSYLITPQGEIAARYDKLHMFDVDLPGGESYRESRNFDPGNKAVLADLPWGRLGLSICYDLRFTGRSHLPAPISSPCLPPLPSRPARRIGGCCCAPAPSRPAPTSSPQPKAGCMRMAAAPTATA